ncbi:hypothetical protein M9458_055415, partial [Cirrhinus mrigala]
MAAIVENLAAHLAPSSAPSWKSRSPLPFKPCRFTSALIGKSYMDVGQAAATLHSIAVLQAYQADVLKELDEDGLFGDAVTTVVEKFRAAKQQSAIFRQLIPRRSREVEHQPPAVRSHSSSLQRHREVQRSEPSPMTPPHKDWGRRSRPLPSEFENKPEGHASIFMTFMTAVEAPTLGVVSRPDRGFACLPAIEASAIQVLRTPMQENQVKIALHVLPVFTDASGSLQSEDVSTPVILSLPYVERLKPLADYWASWSCLPNVSQWVLRTIRHGYTIQFRKGPPPFSGVLPMTVSPWEASILSQEIVSLLEKGAIEEIPPTQMESGFYSWYIVVAKKDGGLRPILDLRHLNLALRVSKFKMLTVKSIWSHIQSADWFVTIELKDAYFHIQIIKRHRKFLRFAFKGKANQYRVLPFGLALAPRTFTKCSGTLRLGARSPEEPRVMDEPTKKCPGAVSANSLLGGGPRLVNNVGTSVPRTCTVVTDLSEPIQNYGDAQRLLHFRSMEEPPFPLGGSPARSVLSSQNYHDGRILYGLGGGPSRTPSLWSLDRGASWLAHKSFGDDGSLPGPQIVLTSFEGLSRLAQDGQHNGFVPESSGRSTLSPPSQAGEAGSSLGSDQVPVDQGCTCPRSPELRGRLALESLEAREWRLHPQVVHLIWQRFGRTEVDLFASSMTTHYLLWSGCSGPRMAQDQSLCFSPDLIAASTSVQSTVGQGGAFAVGGPTVAHSAVILGPGQSASRPSLGGSSPTQSADSSPWHDLASLTGIMEVVGVAPEQSALMCSGLSVEITDTIINSQAPSTRRLYALKWRLFTSWYRRHNLDPVHCPIGSVLEFLQSHFSEGVTPATLKVYVAAISAEHAPTEGVSVGCHPLVSRFMQGSRRLRPFCPAQIPSWDLSIVLEGLTGHPFEPLESVPEKLLTLKTVLLVALSSLKRVGNLQTLSISPFMSGLCPGA